jgi:hypothetical protein
MEKSLAEELVENLLSLAFSWGASGQIEYHLKVVEAKKALIQALTAPAPEDDFPTVRDQFAMAALPAMLHRYGFTSYTDNGACEGAFKIADIMVQIRRAVS